MVLLPDPHPRSAERPSPDATAQTVDPSWLAALAPQADRRKETRIGVLPLHPAWIIRAFARDGHVVHVAFAQARAGDAHELGLVVEILDVRAPT